jgi:hypothetical protein
VAYVLHIHKFHRLFGRVASSATWFFVDNFPTAGQTYFMPLPVKTESPTSPSDVQKRMLRMVVEAYLNSGQPTAREDLVLEFRNPGALDELTSRGILKAVRNSAYLPTALAFHHCGSPDTEELARHAIQTIAKVFESQLLAKRRDFSREDLLEDARKFDVTADAKMIELALFLTPEFPLISIWNGGHDEQPIITPVEIDERLAVPTNLNTLWDDCVRKKDPWANQRSRSEAALLSSSLGTGSREKVPVPHGSKWSRDQKLTLIGVILAAVFTILSIAATIAFPEVRAWLHLPKPDPVVSPAPLPQQSTSIASTGTHERPADWRSIKDWQKSELAPLLESYPNSKLRIIASSLNDETWDYANQFKEFFSAHKWKVIGPETAPTDQVVQNIQLSISEQYWAKQRPEAFTALDTTLRFIGIKTAPNFVIDPLVPPDELVMWIGAQTPAGFPQHPPLQLPAICQSPLSFRDDTMHFIGDPQDSGRWVRIQPPSGSKFSTGQEVLVFLTGPAKSVAASESFQVQALGKVMPRPDALDVTLTESLKVDESLEMKIISDKELRVRCVEIRSQ